MKGQAEVQPTQPDSQVMQNHWKKKCLIALRK
jgi:hypothetical protein